MRQHEIVRNHISDKVTLIEEEVKELKVEILYWKTSYIFLLFYLLAFVQCQTDYAVLEEKYITLESKWNQSIILDVEFSGMSTKYTTHTIYICSQTKLL